MTPQEINRRIAIACGWRDVVQLDNLLIGSYKTQYRELVPDYHGDLNAMHRAVMSKRFQLEGYTIELRKIVIRDAKEDMKHGGTLLHDLYFYEATAAQRAEAFLRTIGQWEEAE